MRFASTLTRRLTIGATLFNGVLAAGNINRGLIDKPAWQRVGAMCWAAFHRQADLRINAMILYPLEAFGGMILSVAAVVAYRRWRNGPHSAKAPLYAAALFSIGGLLATTQAAPIMLSVRHLGNDSVTLQRAFEGFEFWGGIRLVLQGLAYFANIWSLVELPKPTSGEAAL